MNKAIYFNTSLFDPSKEDENEINPIYGQSLLIWLKDKLSNKLEFSEIDMEDWGWYSHIIWNGRKYLIGSVAHYEVCLLYTSPSPRDLSTSRMPSSA